jgi:hypothetical protein
MKKMPDYPNSNPPTGDTPNGTFKNESQPSANDGTDIKAEHMQDVYYALYQIPQLAGEIPNSELENGNNSKQFIKSLLNIGWLKYDSSISYKKSSIVINTLNNITRLYRSQKDGNTDPLPDNSSVNNYNTNSSKANTNNNNNKTNNTLNNNTSWINIITINNDNSAILNTTSMDNTGVFIGAFMYGIRQDTPEGWLICDGAEYPIGVFSDFINNYLLTDKISYKSLSDWNTEYNNNNGNCGYFGYQPEIL